MTRTMTTSVDPSVCWRDGQVTFLSSILTSLRNCSDRVKTLSAGGAATAAGAACGLRTGGAGLVRASASASPVATARSDSADGSAVSDDVASSGLFFFFRIVGFLRKMRPIGLPNRGKPAGTAGVTLPASAVRTPS